MKSKILMLSTLLLIAVGTALGQTINVKGVVYDENGQPMIGATVRAKNDASNGAQTNFDGEFALPKAVKQGEMIIISSVGYKTIELPAAAKMTIKMKTDAELLDEVIVVAFGTAKKESFTGSAAVVDSKQLGKVQATDAVKALEGLVPGLQIANASGAPGAASDIQVRGVGSINASSAPLIILNGSPYDGNINSINTRDIQNISVLKDAASAALYGARGANGVIIITTKSGRKNHVAVELDTRLGVNQRGVPEYDIIRDPGVYYTTMWEAMRNGKLYRTEDALTLEKANAEATNELIQYLGYNIYDVPADKVVLNNGQINPDAKIKYEDANSFNDWASVLMEPKLRQEYNLSLTSGGEKSTTFFSLGYLDDKGYAVNTGFERITSRLSYTTQLYDWLKLQASSQMAYTTGNFGSSGSSTFSNIFFFTRSMPPIYPVYKHDAEGKIVKDDNGDAVYDTGDAVRGVNGDRKFSGGKNIVGESKLNKDEYTRLYLTQNARLDIDLTHGFNFNTTFTHSNISSRTSYFINPTMGDGVAYGGILEKGHYNTSTINWNQVLTYNVELNDFSIQAMLGHESYSQVYANLFGSKRRTLDPFSTEFNSYAQISELTSGRREYNVEGYFGQLTADYLDKYYISASLRRDGSSVFSPDNRWGTFWSLGASWRVNQEDFLKDATWMDNLKLRASIGQQGNDFLMDNSGYRMYTPYTNLYSISSDGTNPSFSPAYKGNPDITWEKNMNLSVGLEFLLFKSRLKGEFDFFTRKTTDMLFNEPVSKTTGFTFEPKNIGSMRNTGFEFNLSGDAIRTENVVLSLGVNAMTYKNKILALPERFKEEGLTDGVRILREGGGINDIYLVKYAGVNPENGDAQYYRFDEETKEYKIVPSKDHRSEIKDRQFIGSAIPKLEGGFNANLMAYGFDLSAQFSYRIGGKMFDSGYDYLMHSGGSGGEAQGWHKDILNRWTPENTNTDIPRLQQNNQKLISWSDMFIIDASYLSLRNLTLGYTLPTNWTEQLGVKNIRVYATADNVFLLSKRKGLDPRTSTSGQSSSNKTSAIRTISGGVTITF